MGKKNLRERTGALDWNDLRLVLAVARGGSLAGAARALALQHSTVFRRIEDAEARIGARLFERSRTGWTTNAQGEAVAQAAAEMEAAALAAERAISGADERLSGVIRIATSELLAGYLLPPLLARFMAEHPGIQIEADVSNRTVDLTRREADIALRATPQPPELMVGRRVGEMRYAVYAHRTLVPARRGTPVLQQLPWVGFDGRLAHTEIAQWFRTALPEVRPRLRADSLPAMLKAAAAGTGAVVLPMFAGSQEPRLVRITPPIEGPAMGLWLLHHPDVRGNARVRALMGWLAKAVPPEMERLAACGPTGKDFAACPLKARRGRAPRAAASIG
ncbi:LysR family transcriptional regulator [Aquincola sp. S2]|uniref:LysR family transcriptional regulator n=1 Tax=Pseudaquabacterium terrae TaxID=2732868 RepID=A0ABX2EG60_9BURK|nr:LysR substrate-binding domain-containing protein [Aquabacterium terrae]NRF67587.1 LysR family transcriptional regulator [Aquabacterium terrae]